MPSDKPLLTLMNLMRSSSESPSSASGTTSAQAARMAPRSAFIAGSATLRTVLSRKAMPDPSAAAAITRGLEDGLHGAAALGEPMTPCRTAG